MKPNAFEEWVTSGKLHLQVLIFRYYTLDSPINKEASPPEIPAKRWLRVGESKLLIPITIRDAWKGQIFLGD